MKLIDVSIPLDANVPTYPGTTPFSLEPMKRLARSDCANVSTLHLSAHAGTHVDAPLHTIDGGGIVVEGLNLRDVEPGTYEMFCLPLSIVGSDGAPARVVLRKS